MQNCFIHIAVIELNSDFSSGTIVLCYPKKNIEILPGSFPAIDIPASHPYNGGGLALIESRLVPHPFAHLQKIGTYVWFLQAYVLLYG